MIRRPLPHAKASVLATRSRRAFSRRAMGVIGLVVLLVASMAAAVACTLNPQPLPPATATKDGGAFGSGDRAPTGSSGKDGADSSGVPTTPLADASSESGNDDPSTESDGGGGSGNLTDGGTDAGDGGSDAGDAGDAGDGGSDAG
jgi:hypothetical protein